MFMWMKLEGGVKDADDITDALKEELVAVVPGVHRKSQVPHAWQYNLSDVKCSQAAVQTAHTHCNAF